MKRLTSHIHFFAAILLSGILASIALIGGLGLQLVRRDIVLFLPLLIALPAMNAIAGDYATLTAAHLADPENYKKRTRKLFIALLVSLPVSCIGISGLSLGISMLRGFEITSSVAIEYTRLIFLTLYIVTFLVFGLIYLTNRLLQLLELNIDDTLIPIATTIASVIMLTGFAMMTAQFS